MCDWGFIYKSFSLLNVFCNFTFIFNYLSNCSLTRVMNYEWKPTQELLDFKISEMIRTHLYLKLCCNTSMEYCRKTHDWHFCYFCISGNIFTLNSQTTIYFTLKREWEPVWWPSGFTLLGTDWRPQAFFVANIHIYVANPDSTFCSPCPLLPYFVTVFAKSKWMLFSVWGLWMHLRPDGHHLSDDSVSARASPAWLTCWEHSHPLCCPFRCTRN